MKRFCLITLIIWMFMPLVVQAVQSAEIFSGEETDLYQIPKEPSESVIFNVTPEKITVKIRIWGMTDGAGNDQIGIDKVAGQTVIVHSWYLNETKGEKNNAIAKEIIDKNGWIGFENNNPSTTIGQGKPFIDGYWMSIPNANMWAFIPKDSVFTTEDSKGNPRIGVIYTANKANVVPPDFAKDNPDKWGVVPEAIYTKEGLEKMEAQKY